MNTSPVITLIHNLKLDRWHPSLYLFSPLPGNPENLGRHKSKGHHTEGMATKEAAEQCIREKLVPALTGNYGTPSLCLDAIEPWDGEGIPASMAYFSDVENGTCKRIL